MTTVFALLTAISLLTGLDDYPAFEPKPVPSEIDGESPDEYIIQSRRPVRRRLRADWEMPDSIAVVYSAYWEDTLLTIITWVMRFTNVLVLVRAEDRLSEVDNWLTTTGIRRDRLALMQMETDTVWIRDFGPIQTEENREPVWLDAAYISRPLDDAVPVILAAQHQVMVEEMPENLDGGALVSNGAGLCTVTDEAFARAEVDRKEVDGTEALMGQLGCRVLTLLPALTRDPTKHVDMFVQFLAVDHVLVASFNPYEDPEDALRMEVAAERLQNAARRLALDLTVTRVPTQMAMDGTYFTYINGVQIGDAYLTPQYDGVELEVESLAFAALADALGPRRYLVPINADLMIKLNGALHCVTLGLYDRATPSLSAYRARKTRPRKRYPDPYERPGPAVGRRRGG